MSKAILDTWPTCQPGTIASFWGILFDEEQYLWTRSDDDDVALLVEHGLLKPSGPREPSSFLRQVAQDFNLELRSGRAWRVPGYLRKTLAA